jgi:hypothetical protein
MPQHEFVRVRPVESAYGHEIGDVPEAPGAKPVIASSHQRWRWNGPRTTFLHIALAPPWIGGNRPACL